MSEQSDILDKFDLNKFVKIISLSSDLCLSFAKKDSVNTHDIALTIDISNEHLRSWYDLTQNGSLSKYSFVEILNAFISKHGVQLHESERINNILRKRCGDAKNKCRSLNGRLRTEYLAKVKHITVFKHEVINAAETQQLLTENNEYVKSLSEENRKLKERCEELWAAIEDLKFSKTATEQKLDSKQEDYELVFEQNKELSGYLDKARFSVEFKNSGKEILEVGRRQQNRKLLELKTSVEKSLWFAETFGLSLKSVSFTDKSGSDHSLTYCNVPQRKSYKDFSEEEKTTVKEILLIVDRFCIGEGAYHELTMIPAGMALPRSYLIKQCKESLNSITHIEHTPGEAEGAQLNFYDALSNEIKKHMQKCTLDGLDIPVKYNIKFSGDGAKMTRLTGFIIISFSILNDGGTAMASKGNHTVAVIKGQESYEILKSSCARIFSDVNKIVEEGFIKVNENQVPVDIFLGSDYKFLLLLLGMKGACSDHACIWCKIHRLLRYDMTKSQDFYLIGDIKRTLEDIKACCLKKQFSCERPPLLNIPVENIVLDELHLMLRVTDKLIDNLVKEALQRDFKQNLNKAPRDRRSYHLDNLIQAISSCGVSFSVWEKRNADGKGSGTFDFTSLMGNDKKILLEKLPQKLEGVISPATSATVIKIWENFNDIYQNFILKEDISESEVNLYFTKATAWVTLFLSLGGQLEGYGKQCITPYIHAMVYHVPQFMKLHKGIRNFSGQGVEKLNDNCRRIHLEKSNKWDAAKDVLLAEERLKNLSHLQRTPRPYKKKADEYWSTGIKESRSKRPRLRDQVQPSEAEMDEEDMSTLTANELRKRLKDMGIKTAARNIDRLLDMYHIAMQ
ncbi:Hypothetical predicted protein [Paramuricea clavata]|uniref:Uncharacterized protein n=1 Tax=Paramuricea clavata TaxID=317549 RepID=A0A7D9JB48_PARCT|nr:Hypothetical predicted protein [Paramuricea clavata]